jgi:hypothetical protein
MSWASPDLADGVLVGVDLLPTPIVDHMRRTMTNRPHVRHLYHVTELLYCLRKAFWKRTHHNSEMNIESLWNIYRGVTFDEKWSPLFKINQKTYAVEKEHLTITGTLDFVWLDEKDLEPVLYDLKMPKNIFYKKRDGAGKFYIEQVQAYLAMAHWNGELTNVHRARVLMLADDLVIQEVEENDDVLNYLWKRAFLLDKKLADFNEDGTIPLDLLGPEMQWECGEKWCPGDLEYRVECKNYAK